MWGEAAVRVAPEVAAGLPWFVGQAAVETSDRSADEIADLLGGLDEAQSELLARLLEGSPMGRTRDAAPTPRPTGRCRDCWRPDCCGGSTPRR